MRILTVTDYDCWYESEEDVTVTNVVENLKKNDKNLANILKNLIPTIDYKRKCSCKDALKDAIITSPDLIEKNTKPEIRKVLLKKYIN
jgi:5'-methylthioadenosine phosphorylase